MLNQTNKRAQLRPMISLSPMEKAEITKTERARIGSPPERVKSRFSGWLDG